MNPLKMLSRGGAVSEPSDADFENVTLLLHGDGTNGAQNNTFLDSSTNNFTITRNGNTTQGTFSPFSKVNGRWSVFFNSANYTNIYAASSADFNFGSGDFTIECFFNSSNAMSAAAFWRLFDTGQLTCFFFSGNIYLRNAATSELVTVVAHGLSVGIWYHLAIVRSGTTYSIYRNGVLLTSGTGGTITSASAPFVIGTNSTYSQPLSGYVSNFRVTTGQALYTTTFTPTTTPLTTTSQGATASNVKLLTCQSNRFVDNSTQNTKTILFGDNSGNPGTRFIQPFSPFPTLTAYDAATNGGSGYFDGSGDYLSLPFGQTPLLLKNSDFSFEAWVYRLNTSGVVVLSGQSNNSTAAGSSYVFYVNVAGTSDLYIGSTAYGISSPQPPVGAWSHIAFARTGGTFSSYLNGVRIGTRSDLSTLSVNDGTTNEPRIAAGGSSLHFGYISGLRLIKGSGGYDATQSTITVPTAPPTAVANTSLLCNFTNAGIIDNSMSNNLETVGNAQIDTTTKKYGTGSMEFDGTGDYVTAYNNAGLMAMGSVYTIEMWFYTTTVSLSQQSMLMTQLPADYPSGRSYFHIHLDFAQIVVDDGANVNSGPKSASGAVSANTWTHLAIVADGSTTKIYLNGTQSGSTFNGIVNATAATTHCKIGGSGTFNGYIDDLRITKGKARYTSNFTPPTAAFEDIGE